MSSSTSRSHRSSISPFRSRSKSPAAQPPPKSAAARPTTPSSRPPSRLAASSSGPRPSTPPLNAGKSRENVTVTVRFRPLSPREINKGDEIAWYADGEFTVRNEYNSNIAYGFDRVFGPATTTRHVYDVAAHHVVSGAMQGINGTVFAYGVTSSGKTHTMHGEQKSPGIIPLAVKDVFGIIQESPGREFLLRVSYLEIYNEVINDLLDPIGQNLRVREDAQGTYVEGIKEEVVLSPAHALSLIASGEEHRHVGSNNFNLLSSRSHTIFTLTIESSPSGENPAEEDVTLSQLNLIDLAGSESSKTETTGLRRKEGSYINKSLLTLGTVISKLTDGKATHVPYRDSKLTRLLQSSLSGYGRISVICTVTPASSNSEETHNTLKFAHRSKHVEIKAAQNKIIDEKSQIKKYQREISNLKQELQQLKHNMMAKPYMASSAQEDLVNLKLQLEAGQVKLQSRLEEEEQEKAALMGRIQRLTKLILVSTKNTMPPSISERPGNRRRHSFGEDELAYLPDRKRDFVISEDAGSYVSGLSVEGRDDTNLDELVKDYKRNRRHGMMGWFKMKKPENLAGLSPSVDGESSASGSPVSSSKSSQHRVLLNDVKEGWRKSVSKRGEDLSVVNSFPERIQAGDLFSVPVGGERLPLTGTIVTDQMDLLREQVKIVAGEVALCMSSLKRLTERSTSSPEDSRLKEQIKKLKNEISEKKRQIQNLEQRMIGSVEMALNTLDSAETSEALFKLTTQLNEKTFELEIKSADNRVLQEQLQMKMSENAEMQETILLLRQQLGSISHKGSRNPQQFGENVVIPSSSCSAEHIEKDEGMNRSGSYDETCADENTPTSVMSMNRVFYLEDSKECNYDTSSNSQVHVQAAEIENLKQDNMRLAEEKDEFEVHSKKMAEEASCAKELAAAAAVELKNLAEEVTKLSYKNAKLIGDLAATKEAHSRSNHSKRFVIYDTKQQNMNGAPYERDTALSECDRIESELRRRLDESKKHEEELENELAKMWVLVAKMRKSGINAESGVHALSLSQTVDRNGFLPSDCYSFNTSNENTPCQTMKGISTVEELRDCYEKERRRCKELENLISRMKGEDIAGLDVVALEELQNLHVEGITKICHAKCTNSVSQKVKANHMNSTY